MKYLADDGSVFDTIDACEEYEANLAEQRQVEKKNRIYEQELANIKCYDVKDMSGKTLGSFVIHSLSNHRAIGLMLAEDLYGKSVTFLNNCVTGDSVGNVYKLIYSGCTKHALLREYLSKSSTIVFETLDVPQLFEYENVDKAIYTPAGFQLKSRKDMQDELDKSIENERKNDTGNSWSGETLEDLIAFLLR